MAINEETLYNAVMNDQATWLHDATVGGDYTEEVYEYSGVKFTIEVVGEERKVPKYFPGQIRIL